jgi:hypothetical protein
MVLHQWYGGISEAGRGKNLMTIVMVFSHDHCHGYFVFVIVMHRQRGSIVGVFSVPSKRGAVGEDNTQVLRGWTSVLMVSHDVFVVDCSHDLCHGGGVLVLILDE